MAINTPLRPCLMERGSQLHTKAVAPRNPKSIIKTVITIKKARKCQSICACFPFGAAQDQDAIEK